MFNAIGYAFDSNEQPDYQYFIGNKKQPELSKRYIELFHRVYQCAVEKNIDTVVMSLVGANIFAENYNDDNITGKHHFQETVWAPALLVVMEQFPGIKTVMMGSGEAKAFRLEGTALANIEDTGYFPSQNAGKMEESELSKTMFVNAWDPWSMVGNGNNKDNSLAG